MRSKVFKQLNKEEQAIFRKLNTPAKVQDFINSLQANFEPDGETLCSPRKVLQTREAHCSEGALLAAAIFWFHGGKPLLIDLRAMRPDFDHVIAPFKVHGFWGAVSKTNHAILRYREPIYKNIRELALSYFHEYFLDDGRKTLRSYSEILDLSKLENSDWLTTSKNLWRLDSILHHTAHLPILPKSAIRTLRLADKLEIEAGKITEYKPQPTYGASLGKRRANQADKPQTRPARKAAKTKRPAA